MPVIPTERNMKKILDKIRMCTDLLNYNRYLETCAPEQPLCLKTKEDPLAGLRVSTADFQCLRRSLVPIIFIIGGPGAGKGRQSELIVQRFGFTHISLGDLVRAEVQAGTSLGRFMAPIIAAGNLVPTVIIVQLLKNAMAREFQGSNGFLIDGFPRDEDQAVIFEKEVARAHLVLFLAVRDSTMMSRSMGRGRADDNESVMANRLRVFHEKSDVLKLAFGSRCKVVIAEGNPRQVFDVVSGHICTMLKMWGFRCPNQCPSGMPLPYLPR